MSGQRVPGSRWEVVIGLEIHAQLATKSKIFSGASTTYGAEPNTQACAIDLALPGALPVLNEQAVTMAVKFGVAIGATVAPRSVFARKNYFYPDLPKGYQISQYEQPIVSRGSIRIELPGGGEKTIGITRAHLEEDAGKSLHDQIPGGTGIDLNRAGTPLIEIVSEPDLRSAVEAVTYMRKIHSLVRYLRICDGNMQEGSFRCDANISIRPVGSHPLGTRTELKNLNSFRYVERAINYEIERQIDIVENGGSVVQETRLYDAQAHETRSMRTKEEANDYRYFPDPDLLPVAISPAFVETVARSLPELPDPRRLRFAGQYALSPRDAALLTSTRELADYFEETVRKAPGVDPKVCANWVSGELLGALNKEGLEITASPVDSVRLANLLRHLADGTVSGKMAKQIFSRMWRSGQSADEIISAEGLRQLTDPGEIASLISEALTAHPGQVQQYRSGATKLLGFFVGQVMKASHGRANPQQVNELLRRKLDDQP